VAEVTHAVFQGGGNIEDASMTRLGGEFVMMLVVGLPSLKAADRLETSLQAMQKKTRLSMNAKRIPQSLARNRARSQATHLISVYGIDRPGIVYRAAKVLADLRINITDLNTQMIQRGGKPIYVMMLEVQIPTRAKATALQKKMRSLGGALRLDVTLQDLNTVAL
jgi:glycine cleavage system transcriptional repressor